jgi:hypothetical protein
MLIMLVLIMNPEYLICDMWVDQCNWNILTNNLNTKDCKENKYDYQWAYTKATSQQTLM